MLKVTYWPADNPTLRDEVLGRKYENRTHLLVEHNTYRAVQRKVLALLSLSDEEKKSVLFQQDSATARTDNHVTFLGTKSLVLFRGLLLQHSDAM